MKNASKHIYYGWWVVGAAFLIMAVGWGSVYNCSSLFIGPVTKELGFTRSQFNLTMTIRAASQMAVSLFAGQIFRRFEIRQIMKIFSLVLVGAFYVFSSADSLWMFYLVSALVAIATALLSILPLSIIISNWFVKGRGGALGLAFMGSGVGGMILSSLTGVWIEFFGWRMAYRLLTLIMAVFIIPCVFFIIRVHPKDMGLQPYGAAESSSTGQQDHNHEGLTLQQAMGSIRFWALNLSSVFLFIAINSLMMNVAPHLTEIGYSTTFSANIVALTMGSLALGKFLLGKLFDRLGIKTTTYIACLSTLAALVGMVLARSYLGLALTILFVGVGCAYATIANSVLTLDLYGKKDFNSILGFLTATGSIGSILGPILTGILYDASGNYYSGFQLSVLFSLVSLVIYFLIFARQPVGVLQKA